MSAKDKPVKQTGRILTGCAAIGAGPGRPKGIPNKTTTQVKEMILAALDQAGGISYLVEQAEKNPQAFLTLVGKVLPLQVTGGGENGEHIISVVERRIVNAGN